MTSHQRTLCPLGALLATVPLSKFDDMFRPFLGK